MKLIQKAVFDLVKGDVVVMSESGRHVSRTVVSQAFDGRGMYVVTYDDGLRQVLNVHAYRNVMPAA